MKEIHQKSQIKLDLKDRKIIYQLDLNARQSYSEIAKKVGLSKDSVRNRIIHLAENGIITGYMTLVNALNLGITIYKVYFQFHNISPQEERELIGDLNNRNEISYVTPLKGNWDLLIAINTTRVSIFNDILNKILEKHGNFILNKSVCLQIEVEAYSRDYLLGTNMNKRQIKEFYDCKKDIKLDNNDITILKVLEDSARLSHTELAKKTGLTERIINYRLKRLLKDNILVCFRPFLDLSKIGYEYYKVLIKLERTSIEKEKGFKNYCRTLPNCIFFIKVVGSWDYELELEVKNFTELNDIMRGIREKYAYLIKTYESLLMVKEYKFKLLALKKG